MAIDTTHAGGLGSRARELVLAGEERGVRLRVLGGVAIALRAGPDTPHELRRAVNDLDLVVAEGEGRRAGELLKDHGLLALSERFNALHGHRRLVFVGQDDGVSNEGKVDVFVGDLEMCHVVPLRRRLEHDPLTLSPTDLLLSKGQIARLTAKDRLDLYNLLFNHVVDTAGAPAPEVVDAAYVAALCARDWGWWRTLSANLVSSRRLLEEVPLAESERLRIDARFTMLTEAIEAAPKSIRWRARSRVGERVRWYEEPEDIEGPAGPRAAPSRPAPSGL
ncbi:MAG TPA: hypothetical protein VGI76_04640 [Solirubrobacteraceae bacterium]|jgi:hypothetical protein